MTINEKFLPTEQKPKFDIVTALLVLLFVVVFIGCYWYTTRLQDEFIQKQKIVMETTYKYEQEKKGIENIESLKKNISELKNNINFYESSGCEILGELSSLLPNDMRLEDISVENTFVNSQKPLTLILSVSCTEKQGIDIGESVSNFIKNIKKSEYFKNATITNQQMKSEAVKPNNIYYWDVKIEFPVKN